MDTNKEINQFTEEELKEIASQLSHPQGENGIKIAESMTETNMGMIENTINMLHLKGSEKVLELGPGEGKHLSYLFDKYPDIHYSALETSELMKQKCEVNNNRYIQNGQTDIALYNGLDVPISKNQFQAIFTVNTLYFWKEPSDFLNQLYQVLKVNGQCLIAFVDYDFMEKLPFTQYGFTKYSRTHLAELVLQTPFQWTDFLTHKEFVKTRTDEIKERVYHIVVLTKK